MIRSLVFGFIALVLFAEGLMAWPQNVTRVLSKEDEAVYLRLFEDARAGKPPNPTWVKKLKDKSLLVDVEAVALDEEGDTFYDYRTWLNKNPGHVLAASLYSEAMKKHRLYRQKPAKPTMPTALVKREERQRALDALREKEYEGMSPARAAERRRILGQVWQWRKQDHLTKAGQLLLAKGSRETLGVERWQGELVKVAARLADLREWPKVGIYAEPAAAVAGPDRAQARWLAGMAAYRSGDKKKAAAQWSALVDEEPAGQASAARAAWWAARAYEDLKNPAKAKEVLKLGARNTYSFYGQLCAQKAGIRHRRAWDKPALNVAHINKLKENKEIRRAFALAQVGQVGLAQMQFRHMDSEIPYEMTESLAAFALEAGLPSTALRSGNALREQGKILWAALYPQVEFWQPRGGMNMDRWLMLAIMRQESAFQPAVGSHAGAQGLMQLMPATARYIARLAGRPVPRPEDLHLPEVNMMLAQDYIGYLGKKLDGNVIHLLAAYNGGIGNVGRWRARGITPDDDPMMYIESIPLSETRDYVQKVMANWWIYQDRQGDSTWSLAALADDYWPVVSGNGTGHKRRLAAIR